MIIQAILNVLLVSSWASSSIVPATRISPSVRTSIAPENNGRFFYSYAVTNGTDGQQEVREIYLLVASSADLTIGGAQNWSGSYLPHDHVVSWGTPGQYLAVGSTLSGLTLSSPALPQVSKFFIRGNAPLPSFNDGEDDDSSSATEIPDRYQDAVTVWTIAPTSGAPVSAGDGISNLIALKHQAAGLGWLRGDEFIHDLDEKLDQAKAALAQSKNFKARKKLEQFIHELNERRKEQKERQHDASEKGKDEKVEHSEGSKIFLDDNAYYLLKVNAESTVSKLPAKEHGEDGDGKDADE